MRPKRVSRIQLDIGKGLLGLVMGGLVFLACLLWLDWQMGALFWGLFLAVGLLKLKFKGTAAKVLVNVLWAALLLLVTWFISVMMVTELKEVRVPWHKELFNIICMLLPIGFFFILTANWRGSVVAGASLLAVLVTVNGFVFQFRGKELAPMDVLSVTTAINVAGQYRPTITPEMVYAWIGWVLLVFAVYSFPGIPKLPKKRARLGALGAELVLFCLLWFGTSEMPIKTWESEGTRLNGYYLNFFLGIRDFAPDKPEHYAPEDVASFSKDYLRGTASAEGEKLPNIIVIMDESYADFSIFGEGLRTNQPVTPFMDSLAENTIRGYALTSVFGGNTANAEFEFLTGHTMGFLPSNSVPYQQYIGSELFSLGWLLEDYGYKTVATHPYFANGWSRNKIYPLLGFEESTFIDSYPEEDQLRYYVSDREMFGEIMKNHLEDKSSEEPLFLFGITMQNHGAYNHDGPNYTQTIELLDYSREYPQAEQYLTLLHETDKAMEGFIKELQDYPEDTVVLFFGDHFPKLDDEFYEEVYGRSFDTPMEQMLQYTVPFFIWANYDIPEENVTLTSLNYLSRHLLEAADLPLSPYHRFLAEMETVIPAINALGYYSFEWDSFIPIESALGKEAEWLRRYEAFQYNDLFDRKHRSEAFFGQYLPGE